MDPTVINTVLDWLVKIILAVVLPLISAYIIQWLRHEVVAIQARTTTDQQTFIWGLVRTAVLQAEQLGQNAMLKGLVFDKKKAALDYLQAELNKRGIPVDLEALDGVIEAVVMSEFNKDVAIVTSDPIVPPASTEPRVFPTNSTPAH